MYVCMYASACMSMEVESLSFLVSFVTIVLNWIGGPSRIVHSVYTACVPAKPFVDRKYDYGPVWSRGYWEHAHLQQLWACPAAGYSRRGTVHLSLFDITSIEATDVDV